MESRVQVVLILLFWGAALGLTLSPALADDPATAKQIFNDLYKDELARVQGTTSSSDDISMAGEMVKAANSATDQPNLLSLLCENAYQLCSKYPQGYDTAISAMRILRANVPAKVGEALTNTITLMEKQYRRVTGTTRRKQMLDQLLDYYVQAADHFISTGQLDEAKKIYYKAQTMAGPSDKTELKKTIKARLAFLNTSDLVMQRIDKAKAKLQSTPNDTVSSETLVRTYLGDLNDPVEAAKYLKGVRNPDFKRFVPLAANRGQGASATDLFDIAEWYRNKLANDKSLSHRALLLQSRDYYQRFLKAYGKDDIKSTRAKLAVKIIDGQVAKLPQMPELRKVQPGSSKSAIDLLAQLDLKKHVVQGSWRRLGAGNSGMLVVFQPAPYDRVTLPVELKGNYHLSVDFLLLDQRGTVAVILPIAGKTSVGLLINAFNGTSSVLTNVEGQKAPQNDSLFKQNQPLIKGKKYTLEVDVSTKNQNVEIIASLNGQQNVHWQGPVSALASFKELGIQHHFAPGLAAWNSKLPVQIHRAVVEVKPKAFRKLAASDLKAPSIPSPPSAPAVSTSDQVDVLKAISPEADTISGKWTKIAGALSVAPAARSLIEAPINVSGNYSVDLDIRRTAEPGGAQMVYLPVGKSGALLQVGQVSRFWMNGTPQPSSVVFNSSFYRQDGYKLHIKVQDEPSPKINVWLNGKPYVSWAGQRMRLAGHHAFTPRNRQAPAVGGLGEGFELVGFRVKSLGGKVQVRRDAPVDPSVDIGRSHSLLKVTDPDLDAEQGDWEIEDGRIKATGISYSRMTIPYAPMGNYEFRALVERSLADGPIHFHLPVGDKASVGVKLGGPTAPPVALSLVGGELFTSRTTSSPGLNKAGFYQIDCRVTLRSNDEARIQVNVNGQRWVSWQGPVKSLGVAANWKQEQSQALGIGIHEASMEIHELRLWLLSGQMKTTRDLNTLPDEGRPGTGGQPTGSALP